LAAIIAKVSHGRIHILPNANDRLPVWENTKLFLKSADKITTSNGYQPNGLIQSSDQAIAKRVKS
jgi:hypothetical protein